VRAKAEVNAVDEDGQTPAFRAAREGHHHIVEALVSAKADVNTTDKIGATPAHHAAGSGRHGVVEVLLRAKADVNKATTAKYTLPNGRSLAAGSTPLDVARRSGNAKVVLQLIAGVGSSGGRQVAATVGSEGSPDTKRAKRDPK
jgi:ankyrin repeat protein